MRESTQHENIKIESLQVKQVSVRRGKRDGGGVKRKGNGKEGGGTGVNYHKNLEKVGC